MQRQAGISKVVIERPHKKCRVTVHTARPGVLIGKKGADIEKLRGAARALHRVGGSPQHRRGPQARDRRGAGRREHRPAARAPRRLPPRHEALGAVGAARSARVGIRINVAGRLGGAEIARTEWYREGRVPLHTLRADIDFGYGVARTAYGIIGIKVWIFKGEIMEHDPMASETPRDGNAGERRRRPRRDGDRDVAPRRSRRRAPRRASAVAARPGAREQEQAKGVRRNKTMLQPKRTKFRKAFKGRIHGAAKGGTDLNFGSHGLKAVEPERRDRAPDRGGTPRHHAPHEARRPRVDPHLPGRAGDEEAGRSPHGLGQGQHRAVGARA